MFIKGIGWTDDTPKRGITMQCRECRKVWTTDLTATEAEITRSFPQGEPVASYCEAHDLHDPIDG